MYLGYELVYFPLLKKKWKDLPTMLKLTIFMSRRLLRKSNGADGPAQ